MRIKKYHILLLCIIVCIFVIVVAIFWVNKLINNHEETHEDERNIGHEIGVLIIHDNDTKIIADILHDKLGGKKANVREKIGDSDINNYIFVGTGEKTNENIEYVYDKVEPFDVNEKYIMPYGTDETTDYDTLYDDNIQNAQVLPAFEIFDDYDADEVDGLVNGWIDTVLSWEWNEDQKNVEIE